MRKKHLIIGSTVTLCAITALLSIWSESAEASVPSKSLGGTLDVAKPPLFDIAGLPPEVQFELIKKNPDLVFSPLVDEFGKQTPEQIERRRRRRAEMDKDRPVRTRSPMMPSFKIE